MTSIVTSRYELRQRVKLIAAGYITEGFRLFAKHPDDHMVAYVKLRDHVLREMDSPELKAGDRACIVDAVRREMEELK
jgi:hypothetical protein